MQKETNNKEGRKREKSENKGRESCIDPLLKLQYDYDAERVKLELTARGELLASVSRDLQLLWETPKYRAFTE